MKNMIAMLLFLLSVSVHAEQISATLSWAQVVTLSTPLSGRVSKVTVDVNDEVKKGQLLLSLDSRPARAELKRAEAVLQSHQSSYEEAKREQNRAEELFDRTVLSQTDLQNVQLTFSLAEAEFRRAEAELELARLNLEYSQIRAPFNGIVVARNIHPGEVVTNQLQITPMLRIAKKGKIIARAEISSQQAVNLRMNSEVKLAVNGVNYMGRVRNITANTPQTGLILEVSVESEQVGLGNRLAEIAL